MWNEEQDVDVIQIPVGELEDAQTTRIIPRWNNVQVSRHPYLGMREHERKAFLETRIPIFPRDGKEARDRALQEREELVRKIKRRDREKDLSLTERESQK